MPPKAVVERALDIAEPQVAVDFFDDASFSWHARVLLINAGAGKWIWATPDLDIQFGDLTAHRVVPLGRGAPYPVRLQGDLYAFDPLTDDELEGLRAEASALASVLGITAADVGKSKVAAPRWIVSDPAVDEFGTVVDQGIVQDDVRFIRRGSVALAQLGGGDSSWVACENVSDRDHQAWLDEKHSGAGRDFRVCPLKRQGPGGPRRQTLDVAIEARRMQEFADWPFRGPRSIVELLDGVRASGMGLSSYANHYITTSGVAPVSTAAHELRSLFNMLRHLIEYDQVDTSNLAGAEVLSRRIIQIQKAIKRSPKHPDYTGLEALMASTLDESGGVVTSKFDEWVATEQRTSALIMKNVRMYQEERDADDKRSKGAPPDGQKKK